MLLVGVANNVYCVHADVVSMVMNHVTRPICYHNSTNIPLCGAQYGEQAFISLPYNGEHLLTKLVLG